MFKAWDVLVASADLEHRRSLIRILEELPLSVVSVSTLQQAEEVLSRQSFALVLRPSALGRPLSHKAVNRWTEAVAVS